MSKSEATWKRRYRAAVVEFPTWAREEPERLIYLTNASGKFEVNEWDRKAGTHRQATDRPEGTGYRVPSRLDPSGTVLWWFDDAKGNERGRWMRQPFGGGTPETIAPSLAPAYSAGIALADGFSVIGRSDDAGTTVHLVRDGAAPVQLYAHKQAATVGDLSRSGRHFTLSHSEHGDSRNRAMRVLGIDGKTVAEAWEGPHHGYAPWPRWSPVDDDERLLLMGDKTGSRRPAILDVASGAVIDVELDLPGETGADWYPDGNALLVGHEHRGRHELYRYDLATHKLTKLPTEPGTIGAARVRPNGDVWYFLNQSAGPATVRALGKGVVLAPPGDPAPRGVSYTDHEVPGVKSSVHCFVARPAGSGPSSPGPTMFIIHGGPSAHDRDTFSPAVQAWVDHGVAVVMVNYRGSSGYGKEWLDAIVGRPGLTELEDIAAVQDWAIAQGFADPKRCAITGGSWGGYLTLLALGVQPARWAAGIGVVPIGDYVAAFEDEMEPLKRYDAALFGGTPAEVPDSYKRSNPLTYADKVKAPLLMLVGLNDPRCPARGVDVYEAKLRELGTPFETYRYDAGHGSLVIGERIKQMELELAFAATHLGTTPPLP